MGTVLRSRIARGMDAPPSTMEASRLNSTPYGSPCCCLYPPKASMSVRPLAAIRLFETNKIGTHKAAQRRILQ